MEYDTPCVQNTIFAPVFTCCALFCLGKDLAMFFQNCEK